MPSNAASTTEARMSDVDRLIEIHKELGGEDVGRRHGVEVLNRSAIVLLTAIWEGYVEELAAEALEHLVSQLTDPSNLPKELRRKVADELKADVNNLAVWRLAADGWRGVLTARLATYKAETANSLNTPKTKQVDALYSRVVGLDDLSKAWFWPGMSVQSARDKLDRLVVLRGDIAHGSGAPRTIRKGDVTGYANHVRRLVGKTDARISRHVKAATGVSLF